MSRVISLRPALSKAALARLVRDQQELLASKTNLFAAAPVKDEDWSLWHTTLFPRDGVYAGQTFHLELKFPHDYPNQAPTATIYTPITGHPNIFENYAGGDYYDYMHRPKATTYRVCLDMLNKRELHDTAHYSPAWSTAYSLTSILMQLYSFFFDENVPQEYGGTRRIEQSRRNVETTIAACKQFKCTVCKHTAEVPFPSCAAIEEKEDVKMAISDLSLKGPDVIVSDDRGVQCTNDHTNNIFACHTLSTKWVTAYCTGGLTFGTAWFSAKMTWQGDQWSERKLDGAVCRLGVGTRNASEVGTEGQESIGYGSTGKYSFNGVFTDAKPFNVDDTVSVLIDKDNHMAIFYVNGVRQDKHIDLPKCMHGRDVAVFPMVTFKNCRVNFNFKPEFKRLSSSSREPDVREKANPWNIGLTPTAPAAVTSKTTEEKKTAPVVAPINIPQDFHTKAKLDEILKAPGLDNCLGWGITVHFETPSSSDEHKHKSTKVKAYGPRIAAITIVPDLLSWEAFQTESIRRGVWGESFTNFLPVMLNREHAERAVGKATQLFARLAFGGRDPSKDELKQTDISAFILDVVSSMMNMQAVSMSQDSSIGLYMSEKALSTYCQLYHILLYMCHYYPNILTLAATSVNDFCTNPDSRRKKYTKDLGKLLICLCLADIKAGTSSTLERRGSKPKLTVVPVRRGVDVHGATQFGSKWPIMANDFVDELLARNVSWAIQKDSGLANPGLSVTTRISRSFAASRTGLRNVMFQLTFLKSILNMTQDCQGNLHAMIDRLDQTYGQPDALSQKQMHADCKLVLQVQSYSGFFSTIGMQVPTEPAIFRKLELAMHEAQRYGYYRPMASASASRSYTR